jgi:hypothetical protein
MRMIKRTWQTFSVLLRDQRSAVRLKAAALASVVVLGTAATGFLLMTLDEPAYQDRTKRLFVLRDHPAAQNLVSAELS